MLHVAFLRSPHAHARIRSIDIAAARQKPGVVAVYTAADLGDYWQPGPLLVPPPPVAGMVFHQRTQVPLAKDKVRHVGEPIAVVVAESRYLAEDALPRSRSTSSSSPPSVDLEEALAPGAPLVHDDLESNLAAHVRAEKGRLRGGARRPRTWSLARRYRYDRGAAAAIESRGVVAAVGRARRAAHGVGHDAGADPDPQRPRRDARPLRAPGAGGRAVHRRRLRAEDHDVLPRGSRSSPGWRSRSAGRSSG